MRHYLSAGGHRFKFVWAISDDTPCARDMFGVGGARPWKKPLVGAGSRLAARAITDRQFLATVSLSNS